MSVFIIKANIIYKLISTKKNKEHNKTNKQNQYWGREVGEWEIKLNMREG